VAAPDTDLLVVRATIEDVRAAGAIQAVELQDSRQGWTVDVHLAETPSAT
jgi:hypothetical protein